MTDTPPHGRPRPPMDRSAAGPPSPPPPSPPVPNQQPPSAGPPAAGQGPAPLWRTLLYILVPTVGVLLLVAAFFFALSGRSGPVDLGADETPGTSLLVQIPNTAVTLEPSADDQVHVRMTGSFFGNAPTLTVRTEGGVTEVRGGCRSQLFSRCSITVAVQLPRSLPTTVDGENGRITASGLTGRLTLGTTNGTIEADGTVGRVDLQTTNGDIRVTDAVSKTVQATTTNGSVELAFVDAPDAVDADSTNGSLTVRVPVSGVSYLVTAQTTNGSVDAESVPSDSTSRRSITARTTNGGITIEATR
ncbi:DUF4097 family beta strand repeat-containing protein [Cryobacterium sp. AP23]